MGFSLFDVKRFYVDILEMTDTETPDSPSAINAQKGELGVLMSAIVSTDSTTGFDLTLYLTSYDAGYTARLGSVAVPALAGSVAVPAVSIADLIVPLPAGLLYAVWNDQFKVSISAAPSTGKKVWVTTVYGTF